MNHLSPPLEYRRSTDMAAEAMINEGGALRQPTLDQSEHELRHLRIPYRNLRWENIMTPKTAFWTGVALGVILVLAKRGTPHFTRR